MRNFLLALMFIGASFFTASTEHALAGNCWVSTQQGEVCPPPPPIIGKATSSEKFKRECVWLPFPVKKPVKKPIVFFTSEADARCIGKNWRRPCPDCQDWIHPSRPRGEVNGPAAQAVLAIRLHDGMHGVSVPRDSVNRIKLDAGWCDFGTTHPHWSHGFNETPAWAQ